MDERMSEVIRQGYTVIAEALNLMEKAGEKVTTGVTPLGDALVVGRTGSVVRDGTSEEWTVRD